MAVSLLAGSVAAADGIEGLLATGKYEEAAQAARAALEERDDLQPRVLLVRALLATGQRDEAARAGQELIERSAWSLQALDTAAAAFRAAGDEARALATWKRVRVAATTPGRKLEGCGELVAAGAAALRAGEEPKAILASYFEAALAREPACKAAYLAGGQLALDKSDDALALTWFDRGLGKLGPDADLHLGRARAHLHGERDELVAALAAALALNPRHVEALVLRAEHELDGEDHAGADKTLATALAVDARAPTAWALRAVLAHVRGDAAGEADARKQALTPFAKNPEVDTLIGRKLAHKYRFAEAAAYQRRALAIDPAYLPAQAELAQDLLRLGDEREGWALAERVHKADGYDIGAYNLVTLRGHLQKFTTLRFPGAGGHGFILRMDATEARIYGDEVGGLLGEVARAVDGKYGFVPARPVTVEVYPDQADFAVRTFGMPGGRGFLGVCFGSLITMNSPAGTGAAPVSWRSVLWHEYTHVVTLGLTGNRIPRWLSEGISVYEEMKRDPSWGQGMTPAYRRMILEDGELVPLGKLSSAFLGAKTPEHVMFAYYQSALAVEFLVERHGLATLKAVLGDLGRGVGLNQALAARAAPLVQLEAGFAAFAKARAQAFAPKADFRTPAAAVLGDGSGKGLADVLRGSPDNVPALLAEAQRLLARGAWAEAAKHLERVVALAPDLDDSESPYPLLAEAMRKLGRPADERKALLAMAARSAGHAPVFRRLVELSEDDPAALGRAAEGLIGANPMLEAGWRARGRASEAGDGAAQARAAKAYERLLLLAPADAADTHLRLARLYRARDRRAAKRHVLEALAEAPRLLPAHRLLLELGGSP